MWNGVDTLYGNEWINYDQTYYKISVAEDGIYRIDFEQLESAGIPIEQLEGSQLQLFHLGEEQAIYTSTSGTFTDGDYLEFWGQRNRSEVDEYLFESRDTMLNPWYSLVTDTSAYFLTWAVPGTPVKRLELVANDLTDLPPKEQWYWASSEVYFTNSYRKVYQTISGAYIYHSLYAGGGFSGPLSVNYSLNIPCDYIYLNGPASQLNLRIISNDNADGHNLEVRVNDNLLVQESYSGAKMKNYNFSLQSSNQDSEVSINVSGLNGTNDRYAVGGALLRYPRSFSIAGEEAHVQINLPETNTTPYLEFTVDGPGSDNYLLYDLTNQTLQEPIQDNSLLKVKLSAYTGMRNLILTKQYNAPAHIQEVNFVDYEDENASFLIITDEALQNDGDGNNWVEAYANYRRSVQGGDHEVSIVDIAQLYDQYAYGVNRHPISIRNYIHWAAKKWPGLSYCFLIGKGVEFTEIRDEAELNEVLQEGYFHLPAFGWPASDNLLAGNNTSAVPIVPIGRLAAISGEEVGIYLEKVEAMEDNLNTPHNIENRAWMKSILHLGGGNSPSEQALIRNHLESLTAEIERNTYGGEVSAFYKTSTEPIQVSTSEQIFNVINEGTSIITFFGHSSPGTFDFNIDNPDNYFNQGKYPLMLSLGCYSGNIFIKGRSISERFVFYEHKGAVAFGASRGLGFISSLGNLARTYYKNLGGDYYGRGIGDVLKASLAEYENASFIGTSTLVEQFTLQGDPAISLYPAEGRDYVIDPASVVFSPAVISAVQDSFTVQFDVLNLGTNTPDDIALGIERRFPDQPTALVLKDTITVSAFKTTVEYTLPTSGREGVGLNTLIPEIDVDNKVAEWPSPIAETNNVLVRDNGEEGVPFFIVDNTARPVYPPEFAIVGKTPVTLKASTTDALAPERTYILEVDTTPSYNSLLKLETTLTQKGGVLEWAPAMNWQDSVVYYWRISPDSTAIDVGYVWEESSFIYVEGGEGWRQSRYPQFKKAKFDGTTLQEDKKVIDFNFGLHDMTMFNRVYGIDPDVPPFFSYSNQNPAGSVRPWLYLDAGMSVLVGDERTTSFWRNTQGFEYDSVDPPNRSTYSYDTTTPEGRQALINLLQNEVPEGYYVFVFSVQNGADADYQPENWASDSINYEQNLFQVLEQEGAVLARALTQRGAVPYTFIYQKGRGALHEVMAEDINGDATGTFLMPRYLSEGSVETPVIGPARSWSESGININLDEVNIGEDSILMSVLGFNSSTSSWNTLFTQDDVAQAVFDLSSVDAETYPFLQLRYFAKDEAQRTMPALNSWRVLYDAYGDLALHAADNYKFHSDTVQQGEELYIQMEAKLLSGEPDSVHMQYVILDSESREELKKEAVLINMENTTLLSRSIATKELDEGSYLISGNLNYDTLRWEPHYFNNTFQQPFYVLSDRKNPVLDVTFDGRRIINGDLVAPNPTIVINLRDENPYFLISDTSLLEITLNYPDGAIKQVYFDQENVIFDPASENGENQARLHYYPKFEVSGVYNLSVQGRDPSGNLSGSFGYEVTFEVITENSISNILNYPNPFSTSTQFVYTLTGSPPSDFRIQVATVSGRIIKEITMAEIGELEVGTHRTDYAWDGTDDYGNKLANGVYLYRVVAKDDKGESYDIYSGERTKNIGRFFKNGWGKMVILR